MDTPAADEMEIKDEEQEQGPGDEAKHLLQNRWTLWYFKGDGKSKNWEDNLHNVITFDTVEDFWAVYNHVKPASVLSQGCDYMIFKEGIKPMWEDARNKKGGRWLVNWEKKDRRDIADSLWEETLMLLIGEGVADSSDQICGAVVQIRPRGDKLAIWTADVTKETEILQIGNAFKDRLRDVNFPATIQYQSHIDVQSKAGSVSKAKYTL